MFIKRLSQSFGYCPFHRLFRINSSDTALLKNKQAQYGESEISLDEILLKTHR